MGSKERSLLPGGKKFEDLIILCKRSKLTGSKFQIQSQLPCILLHPNCQPKEENLISTTRRLARAALAAHVRVGRSSGSAQGLGTGKQKTLNVQHADFKNLGFLLEVSAEKGALGFLSAHRYASELT